ncbi:MAG: VIT1/CCC1 transporter family protein [Parcubacteria group bacterium]|nr:VIT1/CCC1 transporter family protein [Parcubacteria group bacterium]
MRKTAFATFMRNFVFGVEDSLVSTVGLLSGVAVANVPQATILVTGVILIFVEAFSMAVGSFLSESSAEKYLTKHEEPSRISVLAGVVMFFSYFIAGFIPLGLYILFHVNAAFWLSIGVSLSALFLLGAIGAKISQTSLLRGGFRVFLVGGIALGIGIAVGRFFS